MLYDSKRHAPRSGEDAFSRTPPSPSKGGECLPGQGYLRKRPMGQHLKPAETLKQYEQKPVMVMPEDPLFQEDK